MGLAVTTVASGGLPVRDLAGPGGIAVTEVASYGLAVTKVVGAGAGLGVTFVTANGAVIPGVTYATFDGTPLTVTLSNGNLTATRTNTATAAAGARSSTLLTTGKYYFEVTVGATNGAQDCVAIAVAASTYSQILAGSSAALVAFTSNSPIWINGSATGKTLGSNIVAGNVVCCAINLNNANIWFRKNNGLWNGDPTANPATGVGAVVGVTGTPAGPVICFGGTGSAINNNMTGNFGASAFAFLVPSGFTSGWPT